MSRRRSAAVSSEPPAAPVPADAIAAAYWVPLDTLRPWANNPRRNEPAVPGVARSIKRYGFIAPICVWTSLGRIVAGHTRYRAMGEIVATSPDFVPRGAPAGVKPGWVPVLFHEFTSEREANAYALADNKLHERAQWDAPLLGAVLEDIRVNEELLLVETGFEPVEVDELILGTHGVESATSGVLGAVSTGAEVRDVTAAFGALPAGDREPFQQMTFTLHDDQVETVKRALNAAKSKGDFDGPNENSNGNALARVCEQYVNG